MGRDRKNIQTWQGGRMESLRHCEIQVGKELSDGRGESVLLHKQKLIMILAFFSVFIIYFPWEKMAKHTHTYTHIP